MKKLHSSSSNRRDSTWQLNLLSWQPGQGLQPPAPGTLMAAALLIEMPGIALRHAWLRSDILHKSTMLHECIAWLQLSVHSLYMKHACECLFVLVLQI